MTALLYIALMVLYATGYEIGAPIAPVGVIAFTVCLLWDVYFFRTLSSLPDTSEIERQLD